MNLLRLMMMTALLAAAHLSVGCDDVKVSDENLRSVGESAVVEAIDNPEVVLLDVRKRERYEEGHIPSAINIFLPDIRARDSRLANAQRIVVYAGGWNDPLSSAAAKRLIALGYTNVDDFRGGVELWEDAGYELATRDAANEDDEAGSESEDAADEDAS